jgi:hypothetical protein
MGEINVIFGGSMSITSKIEVKRLQWETSLAQRIKPGRKMMWSDVDISFERSLLFMVKLLIVRHKVAKTLIGNRASLNLIMRKTFIEMGLNMKDLTPIHDMFHGVIPG